MERVPGTFSSALLASGVPESPLAGWFADPFGRHELRFWDGTLWTEHVASKGLQATDPPVDTPSAVATTSVAADWYSDPFGRNERRYWDGSVWTEHVSSGGHQSTDPPVRQAIVQTAGQAATPPARRASKKVERQARAAGAGDGETGGGTLFTEQVLVINQRAKHFGSTLGYAVYNRLGHQLGTVQEVRRSLATKFWDNQVGRTDSIRTLRFQVVDLNGRVLLSMTRPQKGWGTGKAKLVVEGPGGGPIGQIVFESYGVAGSFAGLARQLGLDDVNGRFAGTALGGVQDRLTSAVKRLDKDGHARFGLESAGQRLGSIHAESVNPWDFNIQDPAGIEIGRITKTWAGWTKERFTKADNYVVQMHKPLDEPLRSLVIATAIAIDVELKQTGAQTRGSLLGTRTYD